MANGNAYFDRRLSQPTITEHREPIIEVAKLNQFIHIALCRWCSITGYTSRYWLRGYCASFADTLQQHLPSTAQLASVIANDAQVHHIVVRFGEFAIDAQGACAANALLDRLNRESQLCDSPLRAVALIPFRLKHTADMPSAPESIRKILCRCLRIAKGCAS